MKKIFLASLSLSLFFSCSKKIADKTAQTPITPIEKPQPQPPKIEEVTTKEVEKVFLPEGVNPDLLVSLQRTPCYGNCPSYKLEIFKDGSVKYKGAAHVKRVGFFTAIANADFIALIQKQAASINFMKLSDKYPIEKIEIADMPTTISYIRLGNEGKMIYNNFDAPKELVAFERWLEKEMDNLQWTADK